MCCFLFLATPAAERSEENGECQAGGAEGWMSAMCVMTLEGTKRVGRSVRPSVCALPARGGEDALPVSAA